MNEGLPNVSLLENRVIGNRCDFDTSYPDVEASLDIQYQIAVNPLAEEYYVNIQQWMYAFAIELLQHEDPPKVISISWGWSESEQCNPYVFPTGCMIHAGSEAYSKRTSIEFMKLTMRGVTLVSASGDAGAPGRTNEGCMGDNPIHPMFPTSSPWIFSVGGTYVDNPVVANKSVHGIPNDCKSFDCIIGGTQKVSHFDKVMWTSGGGFSNYFERPWWQVNASNSYLNSSVVKPPSSYYNSNGRIYPDVTVVSHNFVTYIAGSPYTVDGTSASTPTFAGMVSRWNALLQAEGKPPLGALGPLFYQMSELCDNCFVDITIGNNHATENEVCNSSFGYKAAKGYDPVYGLGLPNFDAIYNFIQKMS